MTVLLFIIILGLLIFVHELGHFLVAKAFKIRVDEFALGFPPRIFSKKIGETRYAINLIPIGGYVKIFGENPDQESLEGPESDRSIARKPKYVQSAVLLAGVTFNAIFAWFLISLGFMVGLPVPIDDYSQYNLENPKTVIANVYEGSPAESAGLNPGDSVVRLSQNNNELLNPLDDELGNFISAYGGEPIDLVYKRGDLEFSTSIVPEEGIFNENPAIGVSTVTVGTLKLPLHLALLEGTKTTFMLAKETVIGLVGFFYDLFTFKPDLSSVAGPVGIASLVGEARTLGFVYILSFTAIISLNLAFINLIPFPALDGGRLFFILIEAVTRKKIPVKIQNGFNFLGLAFLLGLMVLITFSDVVKFF